MRRLLLLAFSLMYTALSYGQQLAYQGVFAPTESLVKPAEKPYRQDLSLNGLWQFQKVELPANFKEGIDAVPELTPVQAGKWEKTPVKIPSPWNVNNFADDHEKGGDFRTYPSYPKEWEHIKMGWLKRKFTVPENWKGKQLILHFEAVAGDAEVFVNGKTAGKHFGIFLPFELDVTKLLIPGTENEIAIGIRKPSLFDKTGEYGRRTYQAGSFWGQHIAGIWQDVYLQAVPKIHITDVYIKPKVSAGQLEAEVTIKNEDSKSMTVTIDADAFKWKAGNNHTIDGYAQQVSSLETNSSLTMPAVKVTVPANGETKITLVAKVNGKLDLWSTENPNLYGLVIKTNSNGKTIDQKYTRFGWREITFQGRKVLLNGQSITMKGDSWHFMGIPQMTRRYAVAWYQAMRDANLNAVRLHAQPYPSFYLDVADEMGMLVLDETAIWASDGGPKLDDDRYWEDTKNHLSALVLRDRNHPAVFGWSVSNEVMPVITNVMRNPPGVKDKLVKHYGIWADICRKLDPSRPWISADGEDDGEGLFPAYVVHYGGEGAMDRGKQSGKPWGVGEAGNAYYGTPEQVAETNGDRAYESFQGRMEGVAADSYKILTMQRERDAVYRSVFNLVWYGLKPLPLGLKDTTKVPTLNDGVFFTSYQENQPGVQPERLGPYSSTLNPGYDPSLPLYQTWPLFDAIRDASAETPKEAARWNKKAVNIPPAKPLPPVTSLKLLAGAGSSLADDLKRTGVPLDKMGKEKIPAILFIDGINPPAADSKLLIDKVLNKGGSVIVWGADQQKLATLNLLLPAPITLTSRNSSALLPVGKDNLISGISVADLYFSELRPAEIITYGLAGPLVEQSEVLLTANPTDWLRWNKQPEYSKTGSIVRSEREQQPSGVALIKKKVANGTLIVTSLPSEAKLAKGDKLIRQLLTNAGVPLESGSDMNQALLKDGTLVRELFLGTFPISSLNEGVNQNFIDPATSNEIRSGVTIEGKTWIPFYNEKGIADLSVIKNTGPVNHAVAYLSYWVSSSRSLEDLLIEPNMPVVNLEVTASNAVQVYLNGKLVLNNVRNGNYEGGKAVANELKLRQGWNHFLVKLIQIDGKWQFSGKLTSNQPEFLNTLVSALERPR